MHSAMERIAGDTVGVSYEFPVFRFEGSSDTAPTAYLQAALHAGELPGTVAIHALMPMLRKAETEGRIRGAITIVPWANPVGRAQHLFGDHQGRFHVGTRTNFNRSFPTTRQPAGRRRARLARPEPACRCTAEAPPARPLRRPRHRARPALRRRGTALPLRRAGAVAGDGRLRRRSGAKAVVLWDDDPDGTFERRSLAPWLTAKPEAARFDRRVVTTVEYRGLADVGRDTADSDAAGLYRLLVARGVVEDAALPPLPAYSGPAAPISHVEMIAAPCAGAILFDVTPGERVEKGQRLASIVHAPGEAGRRGGYPRAAIRPGPDTRLPAFGAQRRRCDQAGRRRSGRGDPAGHAGRLITDPKDDGQILSKWGWLLLRLSRRLWFRAALISLLAVAAALVSLLISPYLPDGLSAKIGADAVDSILSIIATSMLTVTTFSLSTAVSAYGAATSNVTPRATKLLIEDTTTQNVLATFVGSFLYSLVAIITLSMGAYGERGRVVLFAVTILVILLIVVTLLRWIDYLLKLGRVGETTEAVEDAAASAMRARHLHPYLGGSRLRETDESDPARCGGGFFQAHRLCSACGPRRHRELRKERRRTGLSPSRFPAHSSTDTGLSPSAQASERLPNSPS